MKVKITSFLQLVWHIKLILQILIVIIYFSVDGSIIIYFYVDGSVRFVFLMEGISSGKECFKRKYIPREEVFELEFC